MAMSTRQWSRREPTPLDRKERAHHGTGQRRRNWAEIESGVGFKEERSSLTNRTALARWIAGCPHFERGGDGDCEAVIAAQRLPHEARRRPEPWTGQLDKAPILFVTSNPNTEPGRVPKQSEVPPPDRLLDFYEGYFNRHPEGIATVPTWKRMKIWADQLISADPDSDLNFALTDAVHCASRQQAGVPQALKRCATLYLQPIVEASVARLLICCGSAAASGLTSATYGRVALKVGMSWGPAELWGAERIVAAFPHPADRFRAADNLERLVPQLLPDLQAWLAK
jgi:hypothetical protein